MAFTRPTGEQISFRSATTGTHVLDTYLEACEKGGFTLSALMDNLYASDGGLNPTALAFRVNQTTGSDPKLQARFGNFTDANEGWLDTNQFFFRQKGIYASGESYERLDMVQSGQKVLVCITAHTSAAIVDNTKWVEFFDGNAILSEITTFRTNSEPRLDLLEESVLLGINVL